MLILKPSVYLIGRPYCDRGELDRFLADHGHPDTTFADDFLQYADQIAAAGGKICYDSFSSGRPVEEYLPHIIASKHYSVLEHNAFTVICTGVSRSLTHEFVRHRHFGYSEQSQRYVLCPQRFVVPPLLPVDMHDAWYQQQCEQHRRYVETIKELRQRGLSKKEAHGAARSLLPEATETRIQITGNIRSWRDMAAQRISADADAEIHRLAAMVLDTIRPYTTMLEG